MGYFQLLYVLCTLFMLFWAGCDSKKLNIKLPRQHRRDEMRLPYKIGSFKANWYKAEESCRKMGMRLVTIKGEQAEERITKLLEDATDDLTSAVAGHFWTSGNDLAELGNFFWMSTGEEITRYTNWRRNTPTKEERMYKNWQISPHCIYLNRHKSKYLWDYGPCSQKRYFICEFYKKH